MRTEHLKFPLHFEQTIRLPKHCEITHVTVEDDIPRLAITNPHPWALSTITADPGGAMKWPDGSTVEQEEHHIWAFFEGDYRVTKDENGKDVRTIIEIPEETPTLREIGVFQTTECVATWHILEETRG